MPPKQSARVLRIETTWIRGYGRTYLPSEAGFSFSADDLRASGITLVTVRRVLSHGYVVCADKLDGPGAIWIVEGQDNEEKWYRATLRVISEILDVTLIEIEQMKMQEKIKRAATE